MVNTNLRTENNVTYIGCYVDTATRALPFLGGSVSNVQECSAICGSYSYFGIQAGHECWCGNSLSDATQYGVSSDCPPNQLGATWANDLFHHVWKSDGSTLFMFSNGDCSEWMVTTNDQFNTEFGTDVNRHIIASHFDVDYTAEWHNRGIYYEDPWISFRDHSANNFETILYGENNILDHLDRFNTDKSVNVWISFVNFLEFTKGVVILTNDQLFT